MSDQTVTITIAQLRELQKLAGAAKSAANATAAKYANSRGARTVAENCAAIVRALRDWSAALDGAEALSSADVPGSAGPADTPPAAPAAPSPMTPEEAMRATEAAMLERQRQRRAEMQRLTLKRPVAAKSSANPQRRNAELPPHERIARFERDADDDLI